MLSLPLVYSMYFQMMFFTGIIKMPSQTMRFARLGALCLSIFERAQWRKFSFVYLALLLSLMLHPQIALADQDADFLAARDAFRAGDAVRFDRIAARLKNSPLEPYLAYYRLRLQLETVDAATVQSFLARTDNTPVIDRLRGEWLKLLGKRHQWDPFMTEYPHLLTEDTELNCYALQARQRTQENEALQEARKLWLSGNDELPESCTPLFNQALANGALSAADIWSRVRLALETGNVTLATHLSSKLPLESRLPAAALSHAAANPLRYLSNSKLEITSEPARRVALFALQRLAKQLPQLAFSQWGNISSHFSVEEKSYFYAWLAYEAALRQDARALEWFKAADEATLTDAQRAWRTRAALRVLNWHEVKASIASMSVQQQKEGVWRYWKARALSHLGQPDESEKIFFAMSTEYNFYGQLAADELDMTVELTNVPASFQPGKEELNAMLVQPPIQRALALYRMDLRTDAFREWAWAIRKFDDRQLLAAAEIARRNQMYDRAINTADRTVQLHDFSLRYLAPYREDLRGYIRQNQLEEAWVYGLMRQESRFVTQAKSTVGAAGLMQVMPATARWIARKLGMKDYRNKLVGNMQTNLMLGTYYMKTVLGWFDNNPVLASAAYNAGPSRARQWRGDIPLEGAIYTETIPFSETRDYVKKVMSNTVYYADQFGQQPRTLKQRLGIIAAKNTANQTPIPDEK
jgi:soluble lytic murein transglycosylase